MRGGRARWKLAKETWHTLQNQSDNFAHNDGHGEHNLSVVWTTMLLLAFWMDQTQQLCCTFCRVVWAKLGSQRLVWERRRAWFSDDRLESMRELLEAWFGGFEKSLPILHTDASSSLLSCLRL